MKQNRHFVRQTATAQVANNHDTSTFVRATDTELRSEQNEEIEEYTATTYTQGVLIRVPSGKGIRLRPYSLMSALNNGELPNALVAPARLMLYGESGKNQGQQDHQRSKSQSKEPTLDEIQEVAKITDFLCCQMIMSFKCVCKPQAECAPDEVSVYNIMECDKLTISQFATRGQEALSSFRQK